MLSLVPQDTQELFRRHRQGLVELAALITRSRSLAEDIVQDAFLQFSKQNELQTINAPYPYLVGIVRKLSVQAIRSQVREQKVFDRSVNDTIINDVESLEASPETTASINDEYEAFLAALDELPAQTRRAFLMHYIEGMQVRDIATRLSVSVGKAHSLITEGALHCQERLRRATQ